MKREHPDAVGVRACVSIAFKALRKQGFFARQGFFCCQSCGWAAVPEAKGKAAIFYHKQDLDGLLQNGDLYLAWGGDAALIRKELEAAGLHVEHDGTRAQRFKVSLPKPKTADEEVGEQYEFFLTRIAS
jgi:hypothetical protein